MFKKESHYLWFGLLIVLGYVLYMTYFFPREWADTPRALAFIDFMASIIPALSNLQKHVPLYTNYWGMFYSIFWVIAPVFFLLGLVGSLFLSKYRYQKLIVQTTKATLFGAFAACLGSGLAILFFPLISFVFVDQMSSFLPRLLFSWAVMEGVIYYTGMCTGAFFLKFNLNKVH